MAGSTFGNIFKITTWGESHGKGVGVVVDGCPAELSLCEEDIQKFLNRRKPGQSKFTTRVRRMTPLRFYPVYLREKQPELQSHLLYIIKTSSPRITVKLHPIIVRDMLITPLI